MTRSPVSKSFLDKVETALPIHPGASPSQVYNSLEYGTPTTIRHAIRLLVRQGRATFDGEEGKRRYRRSVQRPDASHGELASL
jgi:hypothetical protein